jgi:hypothetical protein
MLKVFMLSVDAESLYAVMLNVFMLSAVAPESNLFLIRLGIKAMQTK